MEHTPRDPAMETVLGKNPGHLVHRPRHTQTSTWLDYMDNKETRTMPHLPCIHLKCTSMVMDTGNFSIHYSSPVIANICNGSCNIPVSERFTGSKTLPPPTLFSDSGHQAPQSNYEAGKRLQPKRCKHSNVHITMQYLGTGFSVTNEIVNPKDELKMFQQICGGENICVYKGYLSPGETFQFTSKRHYGFPFSASVYINGLIAARISACCEYRYHVGFQQGRRGCFRITQLCGGKPCYRCVELCDQKEVGIKAEVDPTGRACEESGTSEQNDCSVNEKKDCRQVSTFSSPNCRENKKEDKHINEWNTNSLYTDDTHCLQKEHEPPNAQCNLGATQVSTANPRKRLRKKKMPKEASESEQAYILHKKDQGYRKSKAHTSKIKDHSGKIPPPSPFKKNNNETRCNVEGIRTLHQLMNTTMEGPTGSASTVDHKEIMSCQSNPVPAFSEHVKSETAHEHLDGYLYNEHLEGYLYNEHLEGYLYNEHIKKQQYICQGDLDLAAMGRTGTARNCDNGRLNLHKAEDTHYEDATSERIVQRKLSAAFADGNILSSEVELSDSSDSSENRNHEEAKWKAEEPANNDTDGSQKSLPVKELQDTAQRPRGEEKGIETTARESGMKSPELSEEDEGDTLLSQITDLITVLDESDEVDQLVLRNTGMTAVLLQHLTTAIIKSKSQVEKINLNLNDLGPDGAPSIVHLLKTKPCLKRLLLYGNQLGDKGIITLMSGLSNLYTANWCMERGPLRIQPKTHTELTELDIGGNQLTAEGLQSVAAFLRLNPPLKYIGLAQSTIGSWAAWVELFDAMKINKNITHMLLDENNLGNAGARLLAEVIEVSQSLVNIDLDSNDIGEEGGSALIRSLASNASSVLKHLSLDENHICAETMARIQKQLTLHVNP